MVSVNPKSYLETYHNLSICSVSQLSLVSRVDVDHWHLLSPTESIQKLRVPSGFCTMMVGAEEQLDLLALIFHTSSQWLSRISSIHYWGIRTVCVQMQRAGFFSLCGSLGG